MITDAAIIDAPLKPALNFQWLKNQGISYLQALAGDKWTNFNDSDPGVTILDQLCYALTELGYCIDFPIADILTGADGKINYEQQFFLPQDILTCAPISLMDYRKYLLDAMPQISNVYIQAYQSPTDSQFNQLIGIYQVYLVPDMAYIKGTFGASVQSDVTENDMEPLDKLQQLENTAQQLLAAQRNMAEWFAPVVALKPQAVVLDGNITLAIGANKDEVKAEINRVLADWVCPAIVRYGYDSLVEQGFSTDQIFNGPLMSRGWIKDQDLASCKRSCIELKTVSGLIANVAGVETINQLSLLTDDADNVQQLMIASEKMAEFDIQSLLLIEPIDAPLSMEQQLNDELKLLTQAHRSATVGASVDIAPKPPHGDYRQISEYYSIQNTFPSEYGVGFESVPVDASEFRIAQIRQLKGYLTIFDQVLANQFSQLSELGQLFSFKAQSTIAYARTTNNKLEAYSGLPYQQNPPTYFSQPVYDIPHVEHLLLDNQMYRFDLKPMNTKAQKQRIWQEYKNDPFNRYIYGMRQDMETDSERTDRQQRLLDHLLSRHGESADDIDHIITTARWYGSMSQTRIILKRILLQNYQLLSYHRVKGANYLLVDVLKPPGRYSLNYRGFKQAKAFDLPPQLFRPLVNFAASSKSVLVKRVLRKLQSHKVSKGWNKATLVKFIQRCLDFDDNFVAGQRLDYGLYRNGQLDMEKLAKREQIKVSDFNNFACVELYMNLLLGLVGHYKTCLDVLFSLVNSKDYRQWIKSQPGDKKSFALTDSMVSIEVTRHVVTDDTVDTDGAGTYDVICFDGVELLYIKQQQNNCVVPNSQKVTIDSYEKVIEQLMWLAANTKGCLFLEPVSWLDGVTEANQIAYQPAYYGLLTILCVPHYICSFQSKPEITNLYQQINLMVAKLWPVQVRNALLSLKYSDLDSAIEHYVCWQNAYVAAFAGNTTAAKNATNAGIKLAQLLFPLIYSSLSQQGGDNAASE